MLVVDYIEEGSKKKVQSGTYKAYLYVTRKEGEYYCFRIRIFFTPLVAEICKVLEGEIWFNKKEEKNSKQEFTES